MNNNDVDKLGAPFSIQERGRKMKVSKSQGVLYIFNLLLQHQFIIKQDIMNDLEISELSFWRYIQELKAFIYNFNLPYDIRYDRGEDKYSLIEK